MLGNRPDPAAQLPFDLSQVTCSEAPVFSSPSEHGIGWESPVLRICLPGSQTAS